MKKSVWQICFFWVLLFACAGLEALHAGVPSAWLENLDTYQENMLVMARVYSNGTALKLSGSKIAVFYNGELRGVADYDDSDGYYFYNLTVRAAATTESGYTFQFYHPTEDKVYDLTLPDSAASMKFDQMGYGKFNDQGEFEPLILTLPAEPTMQITLVPNTAKWKLDSGAWNASGTKVTTTVGKHTITYQEATGYTTPASDTVTLTAGQTYTKTITYVAIAPTVTVTLVPNTAKWKLDSGAWNASGTKVTTTVGKHTISFQEVDGYTTPDNISIDLAAGQAYTRTTTYVKDTNPVPDWKEKCDINTANNMTFAVQVLLADGTYATAEKSLIGVFSGDVCCGYAELNNSPFGLVYEGYVYSNETSVKDLTMKLYEAASGKILDIWEKLDFVADAQYGTEQEPKLFRAGLKTVTWNLKSGWTWVAMNVVPEDAGVATLLKDYKATAGDQIKTLDAQSTYYVSTKYTGWSPALTLKPGVMYMVRRQATASEAVSIVGTPCGDDASLQLAKGWNWIGLFTMEDSGSISALAYSGKFAANDQIKSQASATTYYVSSKFTGWSGSLNALTSGLGYKMKVQNAGTLSISGEATRNGAVLNASGQSATCPWSRDENVSNTMTFVVTLKYADGGYLENADTAVGVFEADGTCIGMANYVESPFGGVYEGVIGRNSASKLSGLTLKVWDGIRKSESVISGTTCTFEDNAQWGNEEEPVELALAYPQKTAAKYAIRVVNGTADQAEAEQGATVTATAQAVKLDGADGLKFQKWTASGVVLEDAASPVVQFTMPASDVTLTAVYEKLSFTIPEGWEPASAGTAAMTVFGCVKLPNGVAVDCADSMVGCFDKQGKCRGIGTVDTALSKASGYSVYCLQVADGTQQKDLALRFWNNLTKEVLGICQSLDFKAGSGDGSILAWETEYFLNDASNPESPYYSEAVFGEDPDGTVFSVILDMSWDNSIIGYDYKLRLHAKATDGYDGDYDQELPPHVPPYQYEEYAYFLCGDSLGLQVDTRPAQERQATWTMSVTVPEGKPAILGWSKEDIPEGWDAVVQTRDAKDVLKATVDMKSQDSLEIKDAGEWQLVFLFTEKLPEYSFGYSLVPGWNIITPTLNLNQESMKALLALKPMCLDGGEYVQVAEADIQPGKALWIFCTEEQSLTLQGTAVTDWKLSVPAGWSMVGAVEDVPAGKLPANLSSAWTWTPAGYRQVKEFTAGTGYWVYCLK